MREKTFSSFYRRFDAHRWQHLQCWLLDCNWRKINTENAASCKRVEGRNSGPQQNSPKNNKKKQWKLQEISFTRRSAFQRGYIIVVALAVNITLFVIITVIINIELDVAIIPSFCFKNITKYAPALLVVPV